MSSDKFNLTYDDGRHYYSYQTKMSLDKAKEVIAKRVAKYWAGSPNIEYTEWGNGEIEVFVSYYKDDVGRKVAYLNKD